MRFLSILGLVAATVLVSAPAQAVVAAVEFSGSTTGCFGSDCSPSSPASVNHLTFNGGSFNDIPAGPVSGTNGGLGSFTLGNGTASYDTTFTLDVAFTVPTSTSPSGQTFDASVTGSVQGNGGQVTIDFSNPSETFTFSGGSFTLTVGDLTVNTGDPNLTGTITVNAAVPEASTWAMMLLGFAGFGFIAYRRKSKPILMAA
jgi:hypothetical protein